jgi:hypothetical protein
MAGNGAATATAAAKKGTASSKDGAGNGTTAAAAKKSSASSTDGATAASKDGWQRLCCSLQKKTYMVPNKKIKQIISIISLLQTPNIILIKVTTLGSAMPERCLSEGFNPSAG